MFGIGNLYGVLNTWFSWGTALPVEGPQKDETQSGETSLTVANNPTIPIIKITHVDDQPSPPSSPPNQKVTNSFDSVIKQTSESNLTQDKEQATDTSSIYSVLTALSPRVKRVITSPQTGRRSILSPTVGLPPEERITQVFNYLIKVPEFKQIWDKVNENLHDVVQIIPIPNSGDEYTKRAAFKSIACTITNCQQPSTGFPHSFKIQTNAQRGNDLQIAGEIIFETCNALSWPKYNELKQTVREIKVNKETAPKVAEELAKEKERIEFKVLQTAKRVADAVDPKILGSTDPQLFRNFETYLAKQQTDGHVQQYTKEFTRALTPRTRRRLTANKVKSTAKSVDATTSRSTSPHFKVVLPINNDIKDSDINIQEVD